MKESQIQSKIIKELKQMGAYVVKVVSGTRDGIPDLLLCYKGKFIALEIKKDSKSNLSELQKYNIDKITLAGGIALPVYGLQDWRENVLPKIMKVKD